MNTYIMVPGIMLAIPRHPPQYEKDDTKPKSPEELAEQPQEDFKIYDNVFIWRILLLIVMAGFTVAGFVAFICMHAIVPVRAQTIKKVKL